MTGSIPLLVLGCVAAGAGVAGLRLTWALPRRSVRGNSAAWTLLAAGVAGGVIAAGAWGVSVVTLVATAVAFVILIHSASTAKEKRATPPARRAHVMAGKGEPTQLARRIVTFLFVVPLASATSVLIALLLRQMTIGAGEADANVTALYAMPVAWSVLMTVIMMQSGQLVRLATAVLPGLLAVALLWAWGAA